MKIRVNNLIYDSIVDGPGLRTTLFTQGCSHHCPGCHNPSTWSSMKGELTETQELIEQIRTFSNKGFTFSGGEPFEQSDACQEIALALTKHGINLWAYSGYTWEEILKDEKKISFLSSLDVLVDGKFRQNEKSLTLLFKGSRNQRIIDVQKSLKVNRIILFELNSKRYTNQKEEGIYI